METCEGRHSQMHLLLDGELTPEQEVSLKAHLNTCSSCREQMRDLEHARVALEKGLERHIVLPDDAVVVKRAIEASPRGQRKPFFAGFLKKALIGAAACIAALIFSVYLFVHFYFGKTFSNQLDGEVIRCSGGMLVGYSGDDWKALKSGARLKKGTRIRTPGGTNSFVSFDGIRLLTDDASEIKIGGFRSFSLVDGNFDIAAARLKSPLKIAIGRDMLTTNDSVVRVSAGNASFSAECMTGSAELMESQNVGHPLPAGQKAVIAGQEIQFSQGSAQDVFAAFKIPVVDRIRERFNRVMAKYAYRFFDDGRYARFSRLFSRKTSGWGAAGLQFASYMDGDFLAFAKADAGRTMAEYYDALFVPSNRSLSIGRQKVISLGSDKAASFPAWSHDGAMIAYTEYYTNNWPAEVKVARIDDLDHPWVISREDDVVLPMFPTAWAPDNRHVLFMVTDNLRIHDNRWYWNAPYKIKIAPIHPDQGPVRDFNSPFYDIPIEMPIPIGKTMSPQTLKLPWGDALLFANCGNIVYVPIEEDGQAVPNTPGLFLTDFDPREIFVVGGTWSPSGSMIIFMAITDLQIEPLNVYILYDVEDILDGFALPPESIDDPRIKQIAPIENAQYLGGFSFDESLVFYQEDVNHAWYGEFPTNFGGADFDVFYGNALPGEPTMPTQIHLPRSQMFLKPSPEGNRLAYCNLSGNLNDLSIVRFDIEADIDRDLGGVLIDNSGTNLIVPPGALQRNFSVKISTPFDIGEEAEIQEGESHFFAMRLLDAKGLENPKFIEPMTLTIRYTDDEVAGLDESMLDIYYYDESDPAHPAWVPMGATVDPDHNEITVEIQHFSKYAIGGKPPNSP